MWARAAPHGRAGRGAPPLGDINQKYYLRHFKPPVDGPVLEIGSKDYGSTMNFREDFPGHEYVGLDLEEGPGVDVVADLTEGIGTLPEKHFGLVICCSVLEHTPRPWVMAENITRLVKSQGWLFMSVPWVWSYHAYPDDYFRFSFRGIETLFPAFEWDELTFSTIVPGELIKIERESPRVDNSLAHVIEQERGPRKYLPYLMVNMLGLKVSD